jgi:DNA polymerase IV
MAVQPTIFHLDMDAFFVSVEELYDPSLKGKPVVVGGRPNERGVVSAASYAARKFGVHSAMPLRTAYKMCPQAIFVDGHPDRYREYSRRVRAVLDNFSPLVEMASIDEAYLDMTGTERLHGPPFKTAHALHQAIGAATSLNCSIGIATSRLVAKVTSDQAKPNGVLWVYPGCEARFLAPLEIRRIPGVGKVTEKRLQELGIRRVGDLALLDEKILAQRFGKWGLALAGKSRGLDAGGWFDEQIGEHSDPKSISHEHTFSLDTADQETLDSTIARLSEMVARRLREHQLHARTVQIKLRNAAFETVIRSRTLAQTTQLDIEILRQARELFQENWRAGTKVRLIGVHVSGFTHEAGQMNLLEGGKVSRWRDAMAAADRLRDRFGDSAVSLAGGMRGNFRERTHEAILHKLHDAPKAAPKKEDKQK